MTGKSNHFTQLAQEWLESLTAWPPEKRCCNSLCWRLEWSHMQQVLPCIFWHSHLHCAWFRIPTLGKCHLSFCTFSHLIAVIRPDKTEPTSAKINFSYSILFNLTTSYSSYFGGKKGISRNKTSFFLLMTSWGDFCCFGQVSQISYYDTFAGCIHPK